MARFQENSSQINTQSMWNTKRPTTKNKIK